MPSYKVLKSVSHNYAQSFVSLLNYIYDDYFMGHLVGQAQQMGVAKVSIDILANTIEPNEMRTLAIEHAASNWNNWFPSLVEKSGSSMAYIQHASISIEFDLDQLTFVGEENKALEIAFTSEISIQDNRGKTYQYQHKGWWS